MRALICLFGIGFVAAAICSSTADEKVKKDPAKPSAKALPANAPKSAEAKKPSNGKSTTESDEKSAAVKRTEGDEGPDNKYAADEEVILKTGISFVKAYAEHDAKAVAAHFAPDAEFVDENGQVYRGRSEIEETLEKDFKEHPQASIALDVETLRFLSPGLAIEDGTCTCAYDEGGAPHGTRYTVIHTKSDGQWLVASVRERGLRGQRLHSVHLRQLDWLVGNWVDEDEDSVVRFNCQMTEGGNFLVREFDIAIAGQKVMSGSQRTGWDPISGMLRAWTFDSHGGHFDGVWHRDGQKWVLTSMGVTADGESAAGTAIFTPVDNNTIKWQAVDREIDGIHIEDSEEFTLVRSGPQPEMSDEHHTR